MRKKIQKLNRFLISLGFLTLTVTATAKDFYVTAGHGFREHSVAASLGWTPVKIGNAKIGAELEFKGLGKQPEGFDNLSKMASIFLVGEIPITEKISLYGKVGANNTHWSYNGSGNGYVRGNESLWGSVTGVGARYNFVKNAFIQIDFQTYEYMQVDQPVIGGYGHGSISLGFRF